MKSTKSKMRCTSLERDLSRYLDNALPEQQRRELEDHLQCCERCAAQKTQLESIRVFLQQVPEVVPSRDAERRLWEMIERERRVGLIEQIKSWLTVWDLVGIRYLAPAVVMLGIIVGIGSATLYSGSTHGHPLRSLSAEYLAFHYSDPVPYGSIAAAYRDSVELGLERRGGTE